MGAARLRIGAAAIFVAAGLWEGGHGVYIHAKAELAQQLMNRAWEETRSSGRPVPPWRWADTWPVARLRVPALGVDQIVLHGETGNVLAFAPGLVSGSAEPGQPGRVVVSGHRDTHFRFLERLVPGDILLLERADGRTIRYRVTGRRIFDVRAPGSPPYPKSAGLSLVTCYPFDALVPGGPLRFLVDARTADVRP
ncbi:MAG: class GN sortase [Gammaproteobacteria bacterium]|nr:class GN sortase [Gammaproteobacteria bacterium]